ncbi:nuclear transport factor 2 family protein [Enterococcus pingfangensis]
MDTLEKYFNLSDIAGKDEKAFENLIELFSEDAVIDANNGNTYSGIIDIRDFFTKFFESSSELRHLFTIKKNDENVQVEWGVVGRRKTTDQIFTLTGTDYAILNDDNKIIHLRVIGDK